MFHTKESRYGPWGWRFTGAGCVVRKDSRTAARCQVNVKAYAVFTIENYELLAAQNICQLRFAPVAPGQLQVA